MKHMIPALLVLTLLCVSGIGATADVALEEWSYTDNFEDRDLGAWASYPHWQDIAYDPNFRVNEVVPGDPNISIEQRVTPYTNVDNYGGAQKILDAFITPGAEVTFRYFLKSHLPSDFLKVRFAAGDFGKIDVTIPNPVLNRWEWVTVSFADFVRENPCITGQKQVRIYALAFLTKIPDADPDMPFYFCFDDVSFKGSRECAFKFAEPATCKLPEFKPYIAKMHYYRGDTFKLSGRWEVNADRVEATLAPLTDSGNSVWSGRLSSRGGLWSVKPVKLSFDDGLYLGTLTATKGGNVIAETEFTIHIAPKGIGGKHPRLLFDNKKVALMKERFKEERFQTVYENIAKNAASQREKIPVESLIYDLDQFPKERWLPTWSAWGSHIYHTDSALLWNTLAYVFHDDQEAGEYARDVLVRLSTWPDWTHPWQTNRGRFSEHRTGSWAHRVAFAYDNVYKLMSDDESAQVRKAVMKNIVGGAHRTYVYNDNITGKTSNWLAMILGGSLSNQAAMFADGPETESLEPYFTGAALKYWMFINRVTDSDGGAWGEGLGYNNYSFHNMSYSIPSLNNVFNIDYSGALTDSYNELIWAGLVKDRKYFHFGDSGGSLNPMSNWAFLLDMQKEPRLGWFYNFLKYGKVESNTKDSIGSKKARDIATIKKSESFEDVLYDTENVTQDEPFDENPNKLFREVGTTVFKSGWETDDMSFVMRTGAFVNHQHIDQGTFWFADRGEIFIEERHNSTYYDDPMYQPYYTQPVGHSTILIDGNHQSQRVGDHLTFAPGFNDHAFVSHYLDGTNAAFSRGDIGRLYWGKVESLTRNALYIKPRVVLMLDVAVPGKTDVDVTSLYQTARYHEINAGSDVSTIARDAATMHVMHLAPEHTVAEAVVTPHYLYTLQREKPLVKEGMLTVTARTSGNPLVMANLMTTTTGGSPAVSTETGDGFITGSASGTDFAFTTRPGALYTTLGLTTDALAVVPEAGRVFAAWATDVRHGGKILMASETPFTCEIADGSVSFYHCAEAECLIGAAAKPASVTVNGSTVKNWRWNAEKSAVVLTLPAGEGTIAMK